MISYTVFYPDSRSMDRGCPWDLLARIATDRRHIGARAVPEDGDRRDSLVLTKGGWVHEDTGLVPTT